MMTAREKQLVLAFVLGFCIGAILLKLRMTF